MTRIITGRGKRSLEDHFDRNFELEHQLHEKGRDEDLLEIRQLADLADIHYVRQGEALGLGHAVSIARKHVGDNPFVVMLGDDIMVDGAELLTSMIRAYEEQQASVIALLEVPHEDISSYGCVRPEPVSDRLVKVLDIVGEIQLTDALAVLAETQGVYGYTFDRGRYDIGMKIDYLRATVELALRREDLGPAFGRFLRDLSKREGW